MFVAGGVFGGSGWQGWETDEQSAESQSAETVVNLKVRQSVHYHYYVVGNMLPPQYVHADCDGAREGTAGGTVGVQDPLRSKPKVSNERRQIVDPKARKKRKCLLEGRRVRRPYSWSSGLPLGPIPLDAGCS